MRAYEQNFLLHVPSSTENLAMIREFISTVVTRAGMDEKEVMKLTLAVDEAVANVMEHAYRADQSKEVRVRALLDDEQVQIEIVDTGKGFDPSQVQQKDLEQLVAERRNGGLGLRLIQKIMDEVQYRIVPGEKNELRMIKKLKKA
jgi:serine/threonine-protein kinase RsbW